MDITDFVRGRSQDTRLRAEGLRTVSSQMPPDTAKWLTQIADQLQRQADAQERIAVRYVQLQAYAARPYDKPEHAAVRKQYLHAVDVVLRELAWVDADHPDYDEEWGAGLPGDKLSGL